MITEINNGARFKVGEVWMSPRGYLYLVKEISDSQAILKMGTDGSGRKVRRSVDATNGWLIYRF